MDVKFIQGDVVLENVKCLDLDLTLDCGQAFRWEKQRDGSWSGVAKGVFLNIIKNWVMGEMRNITGKNIKSIVDKF